MDDKQDTPPLVIMDMGEASKVTRGLAYITPWLEYSPPPYDYWCDLC